MHRPVGHAEIDVDAGVARQELRQRRRHDQPADAARQVDPQPPGRAGGAAAEKILRLVHVLNQPQAALVEGGTILRRRHLTGRPVQQPRAEPCFERLHRRRNGRARQPQGVGRAGETRAFDDAGEDAEKLDPVHAGHANCSSILTSHVTNWRFIPAARTLFSTLRCLSHR
ncbi:hypothetical protein D9M70_561810 [compost metagenome]